MNKLEALIDKYMYGLGMILLRTTGLTLMFLFLGASKVEMSSISSEELWSRSGRLHSAGSEVCQIPHLSSFIITMTDCPDIVAVVPLQRPQRCPLSSFPYP